MKTRLRTPSTDQPSRRPPHRKKCSRSANCFIIRHPGTAERNQVVLSYESRFNLSSDDNRVRVWRPRGERLNPAFALQRHATPTAGVMVWGVIAYNTRSPLVLIRGTMTAQRNVYDILQQHALSLMQRLPRVIFQQDNALGLTRQGCHKSVSALLLPFLGPRNPQICTAASVSNQLA
ncbi:transposable element Tcb2 transposase [Trichonephila clavipes]|nr:transposable element Tcb2 transposase [Trichonephila clavipes]